MMEAYGASVTASPSNATNAASRGVSATTVPSEQGLTLAACAYVVRNGASRVEAYPATPYLS